MPSSNSRVTNTAIQPINKWLRTAGLVHDITRVKPYSLQELCYLYEICDKTMKKWMAPFAPELGARIGRYYSVVQVEVIFSKLGVPYRIL